LLFGPEQEEAIKQVFVSVKDIFIGIKELIIVHCTTEERKKNFKFGKS
jgi:hypothetical protein